MRKNTISLSDSNPELCKEWDYDRNAPLTPVDVTAGSNIKVWWKGSCGHEWSAVIYSRSVGRGCPYCFGRRILVGFNDFATTNPELLKEWDYEKNVQVTPDQIFAGSKQRVWWRCSNGHNWESTVKNRSVNGHGCPYCTHQKVLPGFNDLLSQCPSLVKEWNYERNGDLKPENVIAGSKQKVWWICTEGHEWKSSISNRTSVNMCGCPICSSRQVLSGYNDLATLNPKLSREWNYNKNTLTPTQVSSVSSKKVWWICDKGHEWEESIANRAKGRGCPYCSGHRVLVGYNDLETINPDVASEWNYDKNIGLRPSDFTCGSNKRVWWKCIRGHEWETAIVNRAHGTGCPYCSSKGSSMPEQGLAYYLSKIYSIEQRKKIDGVEIDVYIPEHKTGIEYDGIFFHSSEASKKREDKKDSVLAKQDVFIIRVKEGNEPYVSDCLIKYVPDNMGPNYIWMINVLFDLLEKRTGKSCDININLKNDTIAIREHFSLVATANSIKDLDIAKEWDFDKNGKLSPDMFSAGSHQKVWWIGQCGHNWKSSIADRTNGNACPYCAGQKVLVGFNDLLTLFPDISAEWNYEKNEEHLPSQYTSHSGKIVWWRCFQGHEWKASIHSRTDRGNGCPFCSGRRTLFGFNDLTTTNPELISEWNYEKNHIKPEDVSIGSGIVVWWKCSRGHEWQARIANRGHGSRCPYCVGQKVLFGFNDFASTNPKLLEEWDFNKNENVDPQKITAGINRKVYWKCSVCGNEWQASINSRTKGRGCPICSAKIGAKKAKKTRLISKGALFDTNPELIQEWNYEKNCGIDPGEVMAGSQAKVWWKCSKGHEWQAIIYSRTGKNKHGCPICNHKIGGEKNRRKVINIDTKHVYESVKQAAEEYKVSSSSIVNACKGLCKTSGGCHWKYIN